MATINTNLAGVTSGSQYASAGNNTIYTNLPFNTAGTTTTNVTFFVGASSSIDILYNQSFRVDSTVGFHELFGNIEVQGVSSDYTVSSWYGKVVLTHKTSGQVISFQLTKPENAASNSGVNVEFLDGAIAFTSNVNAQGVWSVWATQGGTDTSTWGAGGLATQVPGTYSPGATPLDLSVATDAGYLNYSVNSSDVTDWAGTGSGATYTLTTGIDTFTGTIYDDTFNAPLSAGVQTLNTLDSLDGNGGTDTLNVFINASVTPRTLNNIEIINSTFTTAAQTLNLLNAGQVTYVSNIGSSTDATFSNIVSGADLSVQDVAGQQTTFGYATTTGTQTAALTVSNVTGAANVTIAGIETIGITSSGGANSIALDANSANTLVLDGSQNLTLTLDTTGDLTRSVSSVVAGNMTGALNFTAIAQTGVSGSTDFSVTGGSAGDTITVSAITQDVSIAGGAGNDTIVSTVVDANDSIDGGEGTADTLVTNDARANVLDSAVQTTFTNLEQLTVTDQLTAGILNLNNISSSFNTLNLANTSTGASNITSGSETITGSAGTLTINLGGSLANNTAALVGLFTVSDTGTATTDSVVINNLSINSTTGYNVDVFDTGLTSTGYENVTVNVGGGNFSAPPITTGAVLITPDAASANVSLTLTGSNEVTVSNVTTTSTGLLTIDASGINAGSDATYVTITTTASGANGTQSITGSDGNDSITIGNFASTIRGGIGLDSITGGTAADSIDGGTGNDTLIGSGGNDTIRGGEGADEITAIVAGVVSIDGGANDDVINIGATLASGDSIDGGEGTDTLAMSTALIANYAGITNIETLRLDAGVSQALSRFTGTTLTRVDLNAAAGTFTVNNASASLATLGLLTSTTSATFARATDTAADTLAISITAGTTATSLFTSNEETLNVSTSGTGAAGTITTLDDSDLTTLNVSGSEAVTIGTLTAAAIETINITASAAVSIANTGGTLTALSTINASTSTGNVTVGAGSGTDNIAFTGGAGTVRLTTGSGNDTITAGTGTITVDAGTGLDTITGSAGVDSISGNAGADSMAGGGGADIFVQAQGLSVALTASTLTATISDGQIIAFGNGVDVITDFVSGTDKIDTINGNVSSLYGQDGTANLSLHANYFLVGTFDQLTGVFTVNNSATVSTAGVATLVLADAVAAGANSTSQTDYVVLLGTAGVANGDFF